MTEPEATSAAGTAVTSQPPRRRVLTATNVVAGAVIIVLLAVGGIFAGLYFAERASISEQSQRIQGLSDQLASAQADLNTAQHKAISCAAQAAALSDALGESQTASTELAQAATLLLSGDRGSAIVLVNDAQSHITAENADVAKANSNSCR